MHQDKASQFRNLGYLLPRFSELPVKVIKSNYKKVDLESEIKTLSG